MTSLPTVTSAQSGAPCVARGKPTKRLRNAVKIDTARKRLFEEEDGEIQGKENTESTGKDNEVFI